MLGRLSKVGFLGTYSGRFTTSDTYNTCKDDTFSEVHTVVVNKQNMHVKGSFGGGKG